MRLLSQVWVIWPLILLFSPCAKALPQKASVQQGNITIKTNVDAMTITQQDQIGLIDWQSYSLGAGQTVTYQQPNTASWTVNRVTGSEPSLIMGEITANGNVMLLNGNGILIGENGKIDTHGFVASTMDMDVNGLADINHFALVQGAGNTGIVNAGDITVAEGGLLALVAPGVAHMGTINAKAGVVNLASGGSLVLDLAGDGLINLEMSTLPNSVTVPGTVGTMDTGVTMTASSKIFNEAGEIIVSAAFAREVVNGAINQSVLTENNPVINIDGQMVAKSGRIVLHAGSSVDGFSQAGNDQTNGIDYGSESLANKVAVSGSLSVAGGVDAGGEITISGQHIELEDGAVLDASGTTSGKIAVGVSKTFNPGSGTQAYALDGMDDGVLNTSPIATSLVVGHEAKVKVNVGDEANIAMGAYVEVYEGNTPVLLLSGHDGGYSPGQLAEEAVLDDMAESVLLSPNDASGRDTWMNTIVDQIDEDMGADLSPWIIKFNIARPTVNVNRSTEKGDTEKFQALNSAYWDAYDNGQYTLAVDAYKSFHILAERATEQIADTHGSGLMLDLHGYYSGSDPQVVPGDDKSLANFDNQVEIMVGFGALTYTRLAEIEGQAQTLIEVQNNLKRSSVTLLAQARYDALVANLGAPADATEEAAYWNQAIYDVVLGDYSWVASFQNALNNENFDADPNQDVWVTPNAGHLPTAGQAEVSHYYVGGYNVDAHGGGGSYTIPGVFGTNTAVNGYQVEVPSHIRWDSNSRALVAQAFTNAISTHLQDSFNQSLSIGNAVVYTDASAVQTTALAAETSLKNLVSGVTPPADPVPNPNPNPNPGPDLEPKPVPKPGSHSNSGLAPDSDGTMAFSGFDGIDRHDISTPVMGVSDALEKVAQCLTKGMNERATCEAVADTQLGPLTN